MNWILRHALHEKRKNVESLSVDFTTGAVLTLPQGQHMTLYDLDLETRFARKKEKRRLNSF